ncbi:F-box/DUF295 Ancestral 7, ascorbic acid mannose pathway regulator 1 [Hibiscus trionum]|uniref:F-box/DUF295 Ancestral 7, ascorbic acid mannose pathway regulator 1 n=1 Tax=Hibiscus trionum TaxID=183268 RepID=A0A9W7H0P9_HIBTR|nr:F-box/DUF295 Ancestral 7, ascorbic acid mannose pathway regulator 1 [Hibiscus trionum]
MEPRISWSGLPEDLVSRIGKCLDSCVDIIRFRSVCMKWRYSLPYFHWRQDSPLTLYVYPISRREMTLSFFRTTVYVLNQYPISTPWLLKVEAIEQGKLRLINPISDAPLKDLPPTFPKFLNLLDYSALEVTRGYVNKDFEKRKTLRSFNALKAVVSPESDSVCYYDCITVLILRRCGELFLATRGAEFMSEIDDKFDDIAVYRDSVIAVDRWGKVSFFDSSLLFNECTRTTPPILNGGQKKHLVVFAGHLYVVDRYLDRPRKPRYPYARFYANVVSFKVYKWDEERGWTEIRRLDDRILVIGQRLNFFVPIKELSGCRGNYIYFMDEKLTSYNDEEDALIGSTGHGIAVFDLVDQRIGKLSSFPGCFNMLAPPSWFTAN